MREESAAVREPGAIRYPSLAAKWEKQKSTQIWGLNKPHPLSFSHQLESSVGLFSQLISFINSVINYRRTKIYQNHSKSKKQW